jgi:hypothetical protein
MNSLQAAKLEESMRWDEWNNVLTEEIGIEHDAPGSVLCISKQPY